MRRALCFVSTSQSSAMCTTRCSALQVTSLLHVHRSGSTTSTLAATVDNAPPVPTERPRRHHRHPHRPHHRAHNNSRDGNVRPSSAEPISINIGGGICIAAPQSTQQQRQKPKDTTRRDSVITTTSATVAAVIDERAAVQATPPPVDALTTMQPAPIDSGEPCDAVATQLINVVVNSCHPDVLVKGTAEWLPSTTMVNSMRRALLTTEGPAADKIAARKLLTESMTRAARGMEDLEQRCIASHRNLTAECTSMDLLLLWSVAAAAPIASATARSHQKAAPSALPSPPVVAAFVKQLSARTDRLLDGMDPTLQAMVFTFASQSNCAPDALLNRIATELNTRLNRQQEASLAAAAMQSQNEGRGGSRDAATKYHNRVDVITTSATTTSGSHNVSVLPRPVAVVLATAIGAQAETLPGHFQLHSLFHNLMPMVLEQLQDDDARSEALFAAATSSADALHNNAGNGNDGLSSTLLPQSLCSIIQGMSKYSVGGDETLRRVTAAVSASIEVLSPHDIVSLLRALRTIGRPSPHHARNAQQSTERRATRSGRNPTTFQRPLDGVEDDYMPLVEVLMKEGALPILQRTALSAATDVHFKKFLVDLYVVNCQLEYPSWGDMYTALSDALLGANPLRIAESDTPTHPAAEAEAAAPQEVASSLPVLSHLSGDDAGRMVAAVLHRNTAVPFHAIHHQLVTRLTQHAAMLSKQPSTLHGNRRHSSTSRQDQKTVNLALVANLVMAPPSDTEPHPTTAPTNVLSLLVDGDMTLLSPTAFTSALCVCPLAELSATKAQALVHQFTMIAPSLSPAWLARGVTALLHKVPTAVDAVSLHKWLSKVSAAGAADAMFLRNMSVIDASSLLRSVAVAVVGGRLPTRNGLVLGTKKVEDADGSTIALAKQALVRHITHRCEHVAPQDMPLVIGSLCDADLFLPVAFSKLCRGLLPHVLQGDLDVVLTAFEKLAELFTSRRYTGTMFEDVWEALRQRCITESHKMTLQQVILAMSGFAQLDVADRPILLTLSLQLWKRAQELYEAQLQTPAQGVDKQHGSVGADELFTSLDEASSSTLSPITFTAQQQQHPRGEAAAASVWSLWSGMSIEVSTVLLAFVSAGDLPSLLFPTTSSLANNNGNDVSMVSLEALLYSVLNSVHLMYPQGLVQLSTTVYTIAASLEHLEQQRRGQQGTHGDVDLRRLVVLLHRVMDRCREMLLFVYHTQRTDTDAIALQGGPMSAKAKRSSFLPPERFVELVVAIASSGVRDPALTSVMLHCIPTRWIRSSRGIDTHQLMMLIMATCEELSDDEWLARHNPLWTPSATTTDISGDTSSSLASVDDGGAVTKEEGASSSLSSSSAETNRQLRKRLLTPLLDAAVDRMDQLDLEDLTALRRCLAFHFGLERIDHQLLSAMDEQFHFLNNPRAPTPRSSGVAKRKADDAAVELGGTSAAEAPKSGGIVEHNATRVDDEGPYPDDGRVVGDALQPQQGDAVTAAAAGNGEAASYFF